MGSGNYIGMKQPGIFSCPFAAGDRELTSNTLQMDYSDNGDKYENAACYTPS